MSRELQVTLKKTAAGRAALTCRRPDSSTTWARVNAFFPLHDLAHFAVEKELGLARGFYGLIAEGWQLDDFTQPGVAARLPRESLVAENIVGTIERLGDAAPPGEINVALAASLSARSLPAFRALTADELARVRATRAALLAQWRALPEGGSLALEFSVRD